MLEGAVQPPNTARFTFLDPRATDLYVDWERVANEVVAILRSRAGRDPYDRDLSDLVGELSTQSEIFRKLWASHNVRFHDTGAKNFHHPVVRGLSFTLQAKGASPRPGFAMFAFPPRARAGGAPALPLEGRISPAATGLTMFSFTAEPGSKSEEGLTLLASWAA